jgi:AMMECR1 domain-containing protein
MVKAKIVSFNTPNRNGYVFTENTLMAIPDEMPVYYGNDRRKIIGTARNIEKRKDGIYAEIEWNKVELLPQCMIEFNTMQSQVDSVRIYSIGTKVHREKKVSKPIVFK